ncbi:MAG TPA: TlpA disulfide reductase family protein [Polyangiaceae bacterium]|jgi:peroxiredoxin|nr:TlpA disulfide reductase family protein [Polyangiaceae bacterium]
MPHWFRVAFLAALLPVAACSGGHGGSSPAASTHELTGAMAPAFELEPVGGGEPVGPGKFQGKVVVVDFWATWCEPCRDSFPAYQRLVDKFGGRVVVLGVSVDENESGIPAFKADTGVSFPLVWDREQSVAGAYKPAKMPTSYVIDQKGLIRHVHEGFHPGDDAEIERIVTGLL